MEYQNPFDDNDVLAHEYGLKDFGGVDHSIIANRAIHRVTRENKNYLGFAYGQTGSGKSYSMVSFAEYCNPDWGIENIVFKPRQFFDLLRDRDFRKQKEVKVILWDEMGVGIPSKEWYSFQNKAISYIMQTFRVNNIIFLGTAPADSYIDSSVRPLFHQFFETQKIMQMSRLVLAKPFDIVKKRTKTQPWTIYPRYRFGGKVITITKVGFGMPTVKLVHAYESLHKEWKNVLQDEMGQEVEDFENKKAYGRMTPDEIIRVIGDNVMPFVKADKRGSGRSFVDASLIELKFGVGSKMAHKVRRYLEVTYADKLPNETKSLPVI